MKARTIINVGRQFGSGGKSIAEALSARLGIPVYDNELIVKAAEQSGFSPELFRSFDEKRRIWGVALPGLNDGELFKVQSQVIRGIAEKSDAIFVGRASDYVLRDMKCLDVFICAPVELRRQTVAARRGITPEDAEVLIEKMDKARAEYYNFFTFGHWGKAAGYDLCVDSSLLGIEGTADFIIDFGRRTGLIAL